MLPAKSSPIATHLFRGCVQRTELLRLRTIGSREIVYSIAAAGEAFAKAIRSLPLLSMGSVRWLTIDKEEKKEPSGADLMNFSWVALVRACD